MTVKPTVIRKRAINFNLSQKNGAETRSYIYSVARGFIRKLLRADAKSAPFWSQILHSTFATLQIIFLGSPIILIFLLLLQSSEQLHRSFNSLLVLAMADYSFGGTDEENAELKKLNAEVVSLYFLPSFSS